MNKPMVRIHNSTTNEIVDREMTNTEAAEYALHQANCQAKESDQVAKEQAKAALLTRLGITADEAALLLA